MKPYSTDLRIRILYDNDAGMSISDVAAKYFVSPAFVKKLRAMRAKTGSIEPRVRNSGRKRTLAGREAEMRSLIDSGQARTLEEIRSRLEVDVSLTTIWNEVRRLGYRYKKRLLSRPNNTVKM